MFAWTQDVPIDEAMYREIKTRMAGAAMPGLLVHVAMHNGDGTLRYLDVWESEQACDAAFASVVHPAGGPVRAEHAVDLRGEPPRTMVEVIDVQFADGTSRE